MSVLTLGRRHITALLIPATTEELAGKDGIYHAESCGSRLLGEGFHFGFLNPSSIEEDIRIRPNF